MLSASAFVSADNTYLDLDYSEYHKNFIQLLLKVEVKTLGIYFVNQYRLTFFSKQSSCTTIDWTKRGNEGAGWGDIGRSRWKKVEGGDGIGSWRKLKAVIVPKNTLCPSKDNGRYRLRYITVRHNTERNRNVCPLWWDIWGLYLCQRF